MDNDDLFDAMMRIEQKNADNDAMTDILFKYGDVDGVITDVVAKIRHLAPETVDRVLQGPHREPKLALLFFAMWMDDLNMADKCAADTYIPFNAGLGDECKKLLYGKYTTLQDFVWKVAAMYMIGPKRKGSAT